METPDDGAACDREIRGITGKPPTDKDEDTSPRPEVEIEKAALLGGGVSAPDKIRSDHDVKRMSRPKLKLDFERVLRFLQQKNETGSDGTPSTSSENASRKGSRGESPLRAETDVRIRIGDISGRSSAKGSSCSTPISSSRADMEYPSPNFIRSNLENACKGVSIDESQRLTIRLHYNPVMDEWVSLSDESALNTDLEKGLEMLFDLHKNVTNFEPDMKQVINIGQFLKALETTGIQRDDPRLKAMRDALNDIKKKHFPDTPIESLNLEKDHFKRAVREDFSLLAQAFKNQFVIPEFEYFCRTVKQIYDKCSDLHEGQVAGYIPQLARYDPGLWGVSICTVDGQRYSIGDTKVPFTIQSSSKPFTYAVCLNELGSETVHQYVGQEPSGRMFNELSLDSNNKPHNPLLNSGAIMSSALLLTLVNPDMKMSEKFDFLFDYMKRIAGGEFLSFNNSVFLSERETADRNYALAYYMKENGCFPKGFQLQDCLDFYFQSCSMESNCESLAVMGATLANGGVCPITNEEVLKPESVRDVLSLMHSCGMYNYSGQYAFDVGLPAKSGVSGALVLVVPNVMGIGLFSPPLDTLGNTELVKQFRLHRFDNLLTTSSYKIDPRHFKDEYTRQKTMCLLYSATTGDLTALKRFKSTNTCMNMTNYDGRNALHLACAEGHLSCVKFLVEKCQLDPLSKDRWGFTPLVEAKRFRHEGVVDYLVKFLHNKCPLESLN